MIVISVLLKVIILHTSPNLSLDTKGMNFLKEMVGAA
jgi:hypothetical protein